MTPDQLIELAIAGGRLDLADAAIAAMDALDDEREDDVEDGYDSQADADRHVQSLGFNPGLVTFMTCTEHLIVREVCRCCGQETIDEPIHIA